MKWNLIPTLSEGIREFLLVSVTLYRTLLLFNKIIINVFRLIQMMTDIYKKNKNSKPDSVGVKNLQRDPEGSEVSDRNNFDSLVVGVELLPVEEPLEVRLSPSVDWVEFDHALFKDLISAIFNFLEKCAHFFRSIQYFDIFD